VKRLASILALGLALVFAACGGENSSGDSSSGVSFTSAQEPGESQEALRSGLNSKQARKRSEPAVKAPKGPPPRRAVIIKDLIKGSGAVVKPGDAIEVNYVVFDYATGKKTASTWDLGEPTVDNFGTGEVVEAWETGLKGMRVGARRELLVPSKLAYGEGPLGYVVDLLAITPRPR
jgi:peptidylprolyl isomerase